MSKLHELHAEADLIRTSSSGYSIKKPDKKLHATSKQKVSNIIPND